MQMELRTVECHPECVEQSKPTNDHRGLSRRGEGSIQVRVQGASAKEGRPGQHHTPNIHGESRGREGSHGREKGGAQNKGKKCFFELSGPVSKPVDAGWRLGRDPPVAAGEKKSWTGDLRAKGRCMVGG